MILVAAKLKLVYALFSWPPPRKLYAAVYTAFFAQLGKSDKLCLSLFRRHKLGSFDPKLGDSSGCARSLSKYKACDKGKAVLLHVTVICQDIDVLMTSD